MTTETCHGEPHNIGNQLNFEICVPLSNTDPELQKKKKKMLDPKSPALVQIGQVFDLGGLVGTKKSISMWYIEFLVLLFPVLRFYHWAPLGLGSSTGFNLWFCFTT